MTEGSGRQVMVMGQNLPWAAIASLWFVLALLIASASPAAAQGAVVVPSCGAVTYPVSTRNTPLTQNPAGGLCTSGSGAASNQGTPNTPANGWPVKVTDGTNTAAVKPASTAPATTDPAVVVAISPNSVNPNGQATPANSAPVVQAPLAGSDGSTTITSGTTAQNLFSGATPSNGFEVCNPNASDDLWISWSTTAVVNGTGSQRVVANGGCYSSSYAPFHAVSVIGPTTGDKITATKW